MSKVASSVCVVAVVVIVAAAMVTIMDSESDEETYSINYVLNGGVNSEYNPDEYTKGEITVLEGAVKEGAYFAGWYLDEGLTQRVTYLSDQTEGDIVLYAGYSESLVGNGFTMNVDGIKWDGRFNYAITGTVTFKYLYSNGYAYFMERESSVNYRSFLSDDTYNETDRYWSDEDQNYTITQLEDKTIDTAYGVKECSVYKVEGPNYIQIEYISDEWVPYLIEYSEESFESESEISYKLTDVFSFEPVEEYVVDVKCDEGITVSGAGAHVPGSDVTLTVSVDADTDFAGWYDSLGNLISDEKTYSIELLDADWEIVARNDVDPDRTVDPGETVLETTIALDNVEWNIYDVFTRDIVHTDSGESLIYGFSSGFYSAEYTGTKSDGTEHHGFLTVLVRGEVEITYVWTDNEIQQSLTITADPEKFLAYRNDPVARYSTGAEAAIQKYITYKDPVIVAIAEEFAERTGSMTDLDRARYVLTFVQNIEYKYDDENVGMEDYWKFPLETLFDRCGDCEDTSILCCAIMKAMGMDVAFILLPGHAITGAAIDGASGFYFRSGDDTRYYFCETTEINWDIGSNPNRMRYNQSSSTVIPVQ